ncbi:MAG: hypothetical protein ABIJ56_06205, partial [Pseudomonadota bacterium]
MDRKTVFCALLPVIAALGLGACGPGRAAADADGDVGDMPDDQIDAPDIPDIEVDDDDDDCISNDHEGKDDDVDTDSDGTPDYLDTDSDGDTLSDEIEAGRPNCGQAPRDSDGDTIPDFRDDDSDGNGIPDSVEGNGDLDSDGTPDFADLDNDGDGVSDSVEIGGNPSSPLDSDSDSIPDYLDTDSDGDFIGDRHEQLAGSDIDTDGDGIPDRLDDDSDGDGWLDSEEAGDENTGTAPVDTDDDGKADFQDRDSDADGLSDALERENGTNRLEQDTDGDGASDLIEVVYGSDPNSDADSPRSHGDFVFVVHYNDPEDMPDPPLEPEPPRDTLVFSTNIRQADVFFAVDTTASMAGEIENLVSSLSSTIIPQTLLAIDDVWFGVGGFDDYPVGDYGIDGDRVFYLEQRMTSSSTDAQAAVERLTTHDGKDLPESQVSALNAIAGGSGLYIYLEPQDACLPGEIGYPCFRSGSIPIIVLITDATFHNGPLGAYPYDHDVLGFTPPAYTEAVDAINGIHAKVIGVNSGTSGPAQHLYAIATDTGTVDISHNPLVFQIASTGAGLGTEVVNAIRTLANQVPMEISTDPEDDITDFRCLDESYEPTACCPGPTPCTGHTSTSVDAPGEFIDKIVPNLVGG